MKRITHTRARRLSFLLIAVLLLAGMALGALPAAAAESAPYKAEFYASGQLIATVPFDPATGIQAVIEVPEVDGYVGEWESYTLTNADIRIEAIYTPIEGYRAPIDDQAIIFCLLLLIGILIVTVLILVILTLHAKKVLRAHGLWGKGAKENQGQETEAADASADTAAQQNGEEANDKPEEEKKATTDEKERSSTGEATATGKKSNASVEEKAEKKEADSDPTPAEASDRQATASDPTSASKKDQTEEKTTEQAKDKEQNKSADKKPRFIPIIAGGGDDEDEEEEEKEEAEQSAAEKSAPSEKTEETDEKAEEPDEKAASDKEETDKDARFIPLPIVAGSGEDEEDEEDETEQSETEESAPAEKAEEADEKAASDKEATDKDARFIPIPIIAGGGDDEEEEEEEKEEAEQQEKAEPKTMADALSSMANDGREDEMSTVLVGKDGRRVQIKCRQSFRARMICACDESKDYYNDLKNYLLSYEGVSAADSLNYESFSGGRRQLAKLNITGKTVILFLALDPAKLEGSKYKYDNVGDRKRYEKTPVKVKVRSERSFKWAKELIDMTMAEEGRPFVALREEQHVPRESLSRSELIRQGLIQVDARDMENGQKVDEATVVRMIEQGAVPEGSRSAQRDGEQMPNAGMVAVGVAAAVAVASVAGDGEEESLESAAEESGLDESFTLADMPMMANVSLAPEEEYIPHLEAVTAEEAEELVENVVAEHHIEHHVEPDAPRAKGKRSRGKPTVLNIDALDQTYAPGESITLARLKADGLVPKNARSLKILAHGSLTKPLTVEANRFSLTAVKMILLTGGTPVQLD